MDQYSAVRILAFKAVFDQDPEYILRKIIRWYSKTYYTPIAQVEELPFEEILQAYFEEKYEAMHKDDLEAEKQDILTTAEARQAIVTAEEHDEVDMFLLAQAELKEKKKAQTTLKPDASLNDKIKQVAKLQGDLSNLLRRDLPEATMDRTKNMTAVPPNISMTFVSEDEFEAEINQLDGLGKPKK